MYQEDEPARQKIVQFDKNAFSHEQDSVHVSRYEAAEEAAEASESDAYEVSGERNALRLYMREIGRVPLLTPQDEVALAKRIKRGDAAARAHMIQANLRLVVKIAQDYAHYGLPLPDLISEGNIGLVKAVERFDPDKGGKLSTYAAWWIKQSIKRALANQSKIIRLPVHLVDKIAKMRRTAMKLAEELARDPTDDELAMALGMTPGRVAHLKSVSIRPTSLDAPVGDDGSTELGELIGDESAATPLEDLDQKTMLSEIHRMIDELDEREAAIIRLRFGLGGEQPKTLEQVGEAFDITRERVRQLQNIALTKMRRALQLEEKQRTIEEIAEENRERGKMAVLHEFFLDRVQAKSRSA